LIQSDNQCAFYCQTIACFCAWIFEFVNILHWSLSLCKCVFCQIVKRCWNDAKLVYFVRGVHKLNFDCKKGAQVQNIHQKLQDGNIAPLGPSCKSSTSTLMLQTFSDVSDHPPKIWNLKQCSFWKQFAIFLSSENKRGWKSFK